MLPSSDAVSPSPVTASQTLPAPTASSASRRRSRASRWSRCSTTSPARWSTPCCPAFVTGTLGGGAALLGPARRRGGPDLRGAQGGERPAGRPARLAGAAHPRGLRHRGAGAAAHRGRERGLAGGRVPGDRPGRARESGHRRATRSSPASRRPSCAAARSASTAAPTTSARCSARSPPGTCSPGAPTCGSVIGWSVVPGVVAFVVLAAVLRGTGAGRRAGAARRPPPPTDAGRAGCSGRRCWRSPRSPSSGCRRRCCCSGCRTPAWPWRWCRWSGPACTWCGARARIPAAGSRTGSGRGPPWRPAGWCSPAWSRALGLALGPSAAVVTFLALGLVAGLTESAERALVARLAPVRTGRGLRPVSCTDRRGRPAGRALFGGSINR